jgi:hypothetical protein
MMEAAIHARVSKERCTREECGHDTREHVPFWEVDEVYQRDVLAFPPPR